MGSTIDWPSGLPGPKAGNITDTIQDTRIRTPTEMGPGRIRARYTAKVRRLAFPIVLNGAQREMFDYFFDTTLEGGALAFRFEEPTLDISVDARFFNRPAWALALGGSPAERSWSGTVEIEVLPDAP